MLCQVPHLFQQVLSCDKQPALGDALPAFEALALRWQELQSSFPFVDAIIQKGLDKLEVYGNRAQDNPTYTLATCTSFYYFTQFSPHFMVF